MMQTGKSNLLFKLSAAGFVGLLAIIFCMFIPDSGNVAKRKSVAEQIAEANNKIDNEAFEKSRNPENGGIIQNPGSDKKEGNNEVQNPKFNQDTLTKAEIAKLKQDAADTKNKQDNSEKMLADALKTKKDTEDEFSSKYKAEIVKLKQLSADAKNKQDNSEKMLADALKTKKDSSEKSNSIENAKAKFETDRLTKLKQDAEDKIQAKSIEIKILKEELENKNKLAEISNKKKEADDLAKSIEITRLMKEKTTIKAELSQIKKDNEEKAEVPKQISVNLKNNVKIELVLIPNGKFMMGSPVSELGREFETEHQVTITKAFYMGKYEVTQEQWESVMGTNPSFKKGEKLPVTNISWHDCQEFIRKLNKETGEGYRLPTEAEWEYACRAGTTTAFSFGETISKDHANYDESQIKPVGTYKPNAFNLYDMHGNVWEWCEDLISYYPKGPAINPIGAEGNDRVFRGGSFKSDEVKYLRSFHRFWRPENESDLNGGFRLVKTK